MEERGKKLERKTSKEIIVASRPESVRDVILTSAAQNHAGFASEFERVRSSEEGDGERRREQRKFDLQTRI